MAGKTSYKTWLIQVRELQSQAGKSAYERAKLLVAVFSDRDFRADSGALDDHAAAAMLDAYVEDLCLGFIELKAMISAFPNASDWKDGKLATLYERTLESSRVPTAKPEQAEPIRRRATLKDMEELKEQKREVELSLKRAERDATAKDATIDQLNARIRELESENAHLRGRIEQLERSMAVAR